MDYSVQFESSGKTPTQLRKRGSISDESYKDTTKEIAQIYIGKTTNKLLFLWLSLT